MKLIVFGLNHETSGIAEREKWIASPSQMLSFLHGLLKIPKVRGLVYLSTCNRVEVYASVEEGFSFSEIHSKKFPTHYCYLGAQAFGHLLRVASGLNSLALGETQILGQVKQAYRNALELKTTDSLLNFAFQQAFRIAKKIRTETGITKCPTSVGTVAIQLAEQFFGCFEDRTALVVGLGTIGTQVAQLFLKRGIGKLFVANRTSEVASRFAAEWGGESHTFDRFPEIIPLADLVVTATASERPIVNSEMFSQFPFLKQTNPKIFIDLGSPRDMDPAIADLKNFYLYNIDDLKAVALKNVSSRRQEALLAEAMVQEAISSFDKKWEKRVGYDQYQLASILISE